VLVSREPTEKEIRTFKEENKNRKLKEELKATLNFFRITMIFIATIEL